MMYIDKKTIKFVKLKFIFNDLSLYILTIIGMYYLQPEILARAAIAINFLFIIFLKRYSSTTNENGQVIHTSVFDLTGVYRPQCLGLPPFYSFSLAG